MHNFFKGLFYNEYGSAGLVEPTQDATLKRGPNVSSPKFYKDVNDVSHLKNCITHNGLKGLIFVSQL
jgi:hypothetical protein